MICCHVLNMIISIILGFCYKVRQMCDQFLINVIMLERKNFKSQCFRWKIYLQSSDKARCFFQYLNPRKLILEGHSNKCVSNSPSLIQQAIAVKNKLMTLSKIFENFPAAKTARCWMIIPICDILKNQNKLHLFMGKLLSFWFNSQFYTQLDFFFYFAFSFQKKTSSI